MSNLIATVAVLLVSRVCNFLGDFGAEARLIARSKIRFRYLAKNIYFSRLNFFYYLIFDFSLAIFSLVLAKCS